MWKKTTKVFVILVMCLFCLITIRGTTVNAAMADEAEDYELGETYSGSIPSSYKKYYKFSIDEKSHITLSISANANMKLNIYDNSGKVVLSEDDIKLEQNATTEIWEGSQYRILSKGNYYLEIHYVWSGEKYSFTIQAEKQIKLPKGTISSLKSSKKGQMTVKCKAVNDALGYRIQYSTDVKFKKGVKTIYSPSVTKTITGLKKGQRYYVKICPYAVYDDGVYALGQNSSVKSVIIKK